MTYDIRFVDYNTTIFHGYKVLRCGIVFNKNGKKEMSPKKVSRRKNNGFDLQVGLRYNGKRNWWQLQRLIGLCFVSLTGDIDGLEANHIDRDQLNNHADNIEWLTPSENQRHWRDDERAKETDRIIKEIEKNARNK